MVVALVIFVVAIAIVSHAQTLKTLADFTFTEGSSPNSPLVQGVNGKFYGTTGAGGNSAFCIVDRKPYGCGTTFDVTTAGTLSALHMFEGTDGEAPISLSETANGNLFGVTFYTGTLSSGGTVFSMTPNGLLSTLYTFCTEPNCSDGSYPSTRLALSPTGKLYGATYGGGVNGSGTIFQITPSGKLTTVYDFCSQPSCSDGSNPSELIQASNGLMFGTTQSGGKQGGGTVFQVTPSGTLNTLYSFCSQASCVDGSSPTSLVQGTDGDLYGITQAGGANCLNFLPSGCGTIFKLTAKGALTTLYSFCAQTNCPDGSFPDGIMQATDGNLYGTTSQGGLSGNWGTIFRIPINGGLQTVHRFCSQANCDDGAGPMAGLMQATDGNFYGTTGEGGSNCLRVAGCGSVFRLTMGLSPFVDIVPSFGKVGSVISILGNDLEKTKSVTFNGNALAPFTTISNTLIRVTVPAGATTGVIQVNTVDGALSSNAAFRVLP